MKHQMKICDGKINFCCKMNACKHSCCGPFNGISDELKSVENRPFDEIVLTEEDYRRLCDNGCEHFACEAFSPLNGKKYYKMDLAEDGTCKALINGKCSIHDINPTLCKAFPFYFDMFSGLCAIDCEGFSNSAWVELDEVRPFIENAKKMYQFWIDFYND